jgi:hypothetical protein
MEISPAPKPIALPRRPNPEVSVDCRIQGYGFYAMRFDVTGASNGEASVCPMKKIGSR